MLSELRNEYLQAKPPTQIKFLKSFLANDDNTLPRVIQLQEIYDATLGAQSTATPPIQYRITFIKYIIKQVKAENNIECMISV